MSCNKHLKYSVILKLFYFTCNHGITYLGYIKLQRYGGRPTYSDVYHRQTRLILLNITCKVWVLGYWNTRAILGRFLSDANNNPHRSKCWPISPLS